MNTIKTVAVYLGSRAGRRPEYVRNANRLGQLLATSGIGIVYGGASVGTMKALAEGALAAGGSVTGVFPEGFTGNKGNLAAGIDVSPASLGLTRVVYVKDLPERIAAMQRLSDAMVFLPGSFGTMTEVFFWMEDWQLGWSRKPAFVLNTGGYYDGLLEQMHTMTREGFMDPMDASLLRPFAEPEDLVAGILET